VLYSIVLAIHAGGMGMALLLFASRELVLVRARSGRIGAARAAVRIGQLASVLTGVGVVAGIVVFFLGGWPLAPWLLASLALIAALMTVERRMLRAWHLRAEAILRVAPSSADARTLARDAHALRGRLAVTGLFALVALLMTIKPGLGP